MSGQYERQQQQIDDLYAQLMPEADVVPPVPQRLVMPEPATDLAYDYHPDDVMDLVRWERKIYYAIALWLLLMSAISVGLVSFVPLFTALVAVFFMVMSTLFYLRSKTTSDERVEKSLDYFQQNSVLQWTEANGSLMLSGIAYLMAVMVPYYAVPNSLQVLLFLVAMNFTLYTPIAIMRTIRQRTLRKKRLSRE
jgi:membrane protein implicated in regulation of membrane protease activity